MLRVRGQTLKFSVDCAHTATFTPAHFCSISAVRSVAGLILSSANLGPLVSLYVFQALGGQGIGRKHIQIKGLLPASGSPPPALTRS